MLTVAWSEVVLPLTRVETDKSSTLSLSLVMLRNPYRLPQTVRAAPSSLAQFEGCLLSLSAWQLRVAPGKDAQSGTCSGEAGSVESAAVLHLGEVYPLG